MMQWLFNNVDKNNMGQKAIRAIVTLVVVLIAIWAIFRLWNYYELDPWTRDGRVRANVVQLAPDVSGLVTTMNVEDNQTVHIGDVLFEVDRSRYELAEKQAEAGLSAQQTALIQAERENQRNQALTNLVSAELREQSRSKVALASAAVKQAEVTLATAKLNVERAIVKSPVEGVVTNLDLRQGAYVTAGHAVMALVDTTSLYVEGYFEETKLPRIQLGDSAEVMPMGSSVKLQGTVQGIAAGIADHDRSTGSDLLPNVNPSFNWVRLAQRIPVRIQLAPHQSTLIAGQTVTVQVLEKR